MNSYFYTDIPTWRDGVWETKSFDSKEEFYNFLNPLFKEPGQYQFDETAFLFNAEARRWRDTKIYCEAPYMTKDYLDYWDIQKERCRKGVFYIHGDKTWFLPREYYMWLNFLPIHDKEQKKFDFAQVRDAQYHIALFEMLAELNNEHVSLVKKRQIASEQPHSEPILTLDGWKTMGDVKEGDLLWNPDGTPTKILYKTNNGQADVYEFIFSDGRKTRAGIEHNWEVYDRWAKKVKVLNTKELLDEPLFKEVTAPVKNGLKIYRGYRFGIKQTSPLPFGKKNLPIDPYVMGYMLGNGSLGKTISVTSNDREVEIELKRILGDKYLFKHNSVVRNCYRHNIVYLDRFNHPDEKYGINPLIRAFGELGLMGTSCYDKFIPDIYLHTSIEDRISLLQGLNDSDGYVNDSGKDIHYTTVSERLANDVEYLCRSLGLSCIVNKKDKQKESHQDFYRVRISGDIKFDIFRLTRKKERQDRRKAGFELSNIISITKLDYKEESSCIIVDNPNHLYLTKGFIVTHNSYYHCGRLANKIWFEETPILKIGAAEKRHVSEEGDWKFLEEYRSFLNEHTAWYRPMNPGKNGVWQQQIEVTQNNRKMMVGLKGMLQALSFDKAPEKSIGGPCTEFFYDEGGNAPTADITYRYIKPAMRSGLLTTGLFIIAGSVGELAKAQPLKKFTMNPRINGFRAVTTNLIDDKGTIGETGLFIPEQWSMPPFIDEYGNSKVEEALAALDKEFAILKKDLSIEDYQLEVSQRPRNLKEAFDVRADSKFPMHLVLAQMRRIEEKMYPMEYVDIVRGEKDKLEIVKATKSPISKFPLPKQETDKEGAIVIYERPLGTPELGKQYVASIDPIKEGKSTTSYSLFSILIYKLDIEVVRYGEEVESWIEPGKVVAEWTGRFDDINKTHERAAFMLEIYQARAIVEANVSEFINYMIGKRKQHYLVPKSGMLFLKEHESNETSYQEYGWKNTGKLFDNHLIRYAIEFLKEEIDCKMDTKGNVIIRQYGVERIPSYMLLTEMKDFQTGMNVDRLICFASLAAYIKIYLANYGYAKRAEDPEKVPKPDKNLYATPRSFFKNVGGGRASNVDDNYKVKKSMFKNLK